MRISVDYEDSRYTYTERGCRARMTRDGRLVWWGDPTLGIPPNDNAPLVVILTFALNRKLLNGQ